MALKVKPKKESKPVSISMRVSKTAAECLKKLAEAHNMSQADVVENLLREEFKAWQDKKGK